MTDQQAELEWREGRVPVSTRFDDPYFSLDDGLAETRHVFLDGNHLPQRFRDGFHIAELGFGMGLNFLATVTAWQAAGKPGRLHYTGFEAFPVSAETIERALAAFPDLVPMSTRFITEWAMGPDQIELDDVTLRLIIGDARQTVPRWDSKADAWFLDGFAPARNPELWTPELMMNVARHTAAGGTAATYTAAGAVRRGLAAAGFAVERRPGFGRKRHMTVARLPE